MTNNENSSKQKWSLKKTLLFIVLVVLLFATMFSCGLNTFKTTYNQVNQVNYDETTQILTDYTTFNKIDKGIKKVNNIDTSLIGTPVPNNVYIDEVYFNTLLTPTDIHTYLNDNLTFYTAPIMGTTLTFYPILAYLHNDSIPYVLGFIKYASDNIHFGLIDFSTFSTIQNFFLGPYPWEQFNNPYTIDSTALPTLDDIPIGNQNDILSSIISITPFQSAGGSYTPNPQYNIVQPSINGDLILGTMFEPMLEEQTTFSELYVSYILGASEYSYSLNMVINLVLEGVNNYYNISIANNLNINDLSNSSFTNIIANFDSDLEVLNLVIQIYSNNSLIYNYNNSFPCVMNNSLTYPYQVSGFSNTPTAKQYVSSYNSNQAYNNGYNIGNREGYSSGYDIGYDEGYDVGYDEGYNFTDENGNFRGYEQGYHDGSNNEFAKDGVKDLVNIIFNAPYNIFNGFLNFEIFGVNLFNLLSFIFTLVLVGWIIALLMKR